MEKPFFMLDETMVQELGWLVGNGQFELLALLSAWLIERLVIQLHSQTNQPINRIRTISCLATVLLTFFILFFQIFDPAIVGTLLL